MTTTETEDQTCWFFKIPSHERILLALYVSIKNGFNLHEDSSM